MSFAKPPGKKETLLQFLSRGIAMVHVDARRPGATVPEQYQGEAHLRLNLSYRYAIHDLEIGDERVQATLSFGGISFRCVLPWDCIFGITSHATGDGHRRSALRPGGRVDTPGETPGRLPIVP